MQKLLLIKFVFIMELTLAQNPDINRSNHWYFGNKAGLSFNSGSPVADTSGQMQVWTGNATISDLNGNLLMYSDGKTIWNKEHKTMSNGTGLGVGANATPQDGVIFIPKPGNVNNYYLFTVDGWENQFQNGLRWSEIDLSLDSMRGAVISKNNLMHFPCTEQIASIKHANGCDYWIIVHERGNSNFLSYLVTSSGIDTIPTISSIGTNYNAGMNPQFGFGFNLKIAPKTNMVASIISYNYSVTGIKGDTLEIFNFDNISGTFSNLLKVPTDTNYHCAFFSPNGQILYVKEGFWTHKLFQYDLSSGIDSLILNSKTLIYQGQTASDGQIGKDQKIYLCYPTLPLYPKDTLDVINNPNIVGTGCSFQLKVVPLNRKTGLNLPNFNSSFVDSTISLNCNTLIEEALPTLFQLFPNPAKEYIIVKTDTPRWLEIFDNTGKLRLRKFLISNDNIVPIADFKPGLFLIRVTDSTNYKLTLSHKLIINH